MMTLFEHITQVFPPLNTPQRVEKYSNLLYSYQTSLDTITLNNLNALTAVIKDPFRLTIKVFEETISIVSQQLNLDEFIEKIVQEKNVLEDEKVLLELAINKDTSLGVVRVYDLISFDHFWSSTPFIKLLDLLAQPLREKQQLRFHIMDKGLEAMYAENICFTPHEDISLPQNSNIDLNKIRSNCHFENFESYPFTANYFALISPPAQPNSFSETMDKLCLLFCLTGIFDIASLKENSLYLKLTGYKTHEYQIDLDKLTTTSLKVYQDVYKWIYAEKSQVTDKLGLARNVLSLYIGKEDVAVNESVYLSMTSGFKIYLQQNISKYVDARNKIFDQLNAISQKTSELAEKYLNNYYKSNLTFFSFFVSVFILKVVGSAKYDKVFNKDATIIFFCFIALSVTYFGFSLYIFFQEGGRLREKYQQMKLRHEDLLDPADIKNILRDDSEFNDDMKFLDKRVIHYSVLWIITILIFIAGVLSLSTYITWQKLFCLFQP
ncbi:hypothetical protein [Dyadobacter aurulentus]|uniref:hypothetical protein n=1 Tax=Dyadobacter sp. UC 10 TaxID=2605428 RepID=UPI0011F37B30|nr:hypothetical protein [Dyadobacter sp. UC 10]KAA0990906.1 hypothetical protein FXO21_12460 [Dyadobacter sp. UC 10]